MSMISYRLRLWGRLVGELEIESDIEITLTEAEGEFSQSMDGERLIWSGETAQEVEDAS